jgi:hypothetical protein
MTSIPFDRLSKKLQKKVKQKLIKLIRDDEKIRLFAFQG